MPHMCAHTKKDRTMGRPSTGPVPGAHKERRPPNVSGFRGHCLSRLSIPEKEIIPVQPRLVAVCGPCPLWVMSPRPRSGVSHLSDSGGRRVAVRKLLTHGRHRPCIQVLGALLQVPVMSAAAHTPVGTQDVAVPRRLWLRLLHSPLTASFLHQVGGVINTFVEGVKMCAHV